MRSATILRMVLLTALVVPLGASAQTVDFSFSADNTADLSMPYPDGLHSGARAVTGPFDTDGDLKMEMIVTDYSSGGRVHVLENAGIDTWELVYSTPFLDSTGTANARYALGDLDLDGDGKKEIAYLSGEGYSATNPNVVNGTLRLGLYIYESSGADDDYGTVPSFVCEFDQTTTYVRAEQFSVADIDGDGDQEIMVPQNYDGSGNDLFYIYYVNGEFETNGSASSFATCVNELTLARGATASNNGYFDFNFLGGGSPYAMHVADLDGDGNPDLSLHAYNNFNFFNITPTGANTYSLPDTSQADAFLKAAPSDHVSLFGGAVVDINGDGDDEVFYPRYQSFGDGAVSLLNYEPSEDILKVTSDNLILDFLTSLTNFGLAAGDVTGDGNPDLIGAGTSFTGADADAGNPSSWINVAAWVGDIGGDPEDVSNYDIRTFDTSSPEDTTHLSTVVRDSAGTVTTYRESATGKFATKVAYLGDADGDGDVEIAVAFQSVADSIQIIDEVWNADSTRYDRTVRSTMAAPAREFVRVLSAKDYNVAIENTHFVFPDDYKLEPNYPNPFRSETTIGFELPLDKKISVRVYDITGRLVTSIIDNEQYTKGQHSVTWDGRNGAGAQVASGTYFYTLEFGQFRKSQQMVVVR